MLGRGAWTSVQDPRRAAAPPDGGAGGPRAHTVAQVRAAEASLMERLSPGTLMARAATGLGVGVARWLEERRGRLVGARVLLVVGPGNNGGDALFAGAWLARRGVAVRWTATASHVHPGGRAALEAAGGREATLPDALGWAEVALDGVYGIGARPGLDADTAQLFKALREHEVPVIAVDLPSGVDPDTGETPGPHVQAAVTFTFGTHKVATLVDPAAAACGQVRLVDIGLELSGDGEGERPVVEALDADEVSALLPLPGRADHKYTRGVLGVRAGSSTYPGAALLCVAGAINGLAGMVRFVGHLAVDTEVRRAHPEVVGAGRVQAWAVGSGVTDGAHAALEAALADGVPVVADADAVAHAGELLGVGQGPAAEGVVLTPHAGELAALLGVERAEVEARPLHHVRRASSELGAVVLLKGARTLVAAPDGRLRVNTTGTPWLGTAGSGDVLTGLVGSLLAAGLEPLDAASVGAWLHGRAAEHLAPGPLVAGDLPHALREVLRGRFAQVGHSNT